MLYFDYKASAPRNQEFHEEFLLACSLLFLSTSTDDWLFLTAQTLRFSCGCGHQYGPLWSETQHAKMETCSTY